MAAHKHDCGQCLAVTDDGAGCYILVCYSMDRAYEADTWHETLEDAYATAEEGFGIRREAWGPAQDE